MRPHRNRAALCSAGIHRAALARTVLQSGIRQTHCVDCHCILRRNLVIYGVGGVIIPFIGIKLIDMFVTLCHLVPLA